MLVTLENVLDPKQLAVARQLLDKQSFRDGGTSAGRQARRVKNNLEYIPDGAAPSPLNNLVMGALVNHSVYLNAGLPARIAAPLYSLSKKGMGYGFHVDDPVMGGPERYRSDVAITLFLEEPEKYQGGELEIDLPYGMVSVKGRAGDGVMYPASTRHRVKEVTGGERLVMVTWMQSLVADAGKRELLYELYQARQTLLESQPDDETTDRVDHSYVNLVRRWSAP